MELGLAGTTALLSMNHARGAAVLVSVDSQVLKQPRVRDVFGVAGLEEVLKELVDWVLRVTGESRRSRGVLKVHGSHELSELRDLSITSVQKLVEIVVEVTHGTGEQERTTVLVLLQPADDSVDLGLLAGFAFGIESQTTEADVNVDETSVVEFKEQSKRVDARNLLGLRAEVKRLSDESQNATVVVGIVLIDTNVSVELVESGVVVRSEGVERSVDVVQARDLVASDKSISVLDTIGAETGEVVQLTDGVEFFGFTSLGADIAAEVSDAVGDLLNSAEFLKKVRDDASIDVLQVKNAGSVGKEGDREHHSLQRSRDSRVLARVAVVNLATLIVKVVTLSIECAYFQSVVSRRH